MDVNYSRSSDLLPDGANIKLTKKVISVKKSEVGINKDLKYNHNNILHLNILKSSLSPSIGVIPL